MTASPKSTTKKKRQRARITAQGNGKTRLHVVGRQQRRQSTGGRQTQARRRVLTPSQIDKLSEDELLDTRICDLGISIEGSWLQPKLQKLYQELANQQISFRPHAWLSDEWFSPDGVPGIAIPFCLAHPRLKSLERRQMHEIEGGNAPWCLKILRHEAGHALDTAFRLHRRVGYKRLFGNYHDPYPESYRPKPDSKKFVLHLEPWYAQSHPSEDFAETFAVWLKPNSRWRSEYADWQALKKLELVDQIMKTLHRKPAKVRSRMKVDPITRNRTTLREHYRDLHDAFANRRPISLDYDLNRLFCTKSKVRNKRSFSAASFLQKNRGELSRVVAQWTGEYRYNVSQVLREMIERCRELDLRVTGPLSEVKQRAIVMLTVLTMNYLHGGHHRVAL